MEDKMDAKSFAKVAKKLNKEAGAGFIDHLSTCPECLMALIVGLTNTVDHFRAAVEEAALKKE